MNREMESHDMRTKLLVSFLPLDESHLSEKLYCNNIYQLRFFDPDCISQSENGSLPLFDDHCQWLKSHIRNHPFYYVLVREGKFLGYLYGRTESAGIVLSVAIVKDERMKGLAGLAIDYALKRHSPSIWYARIKPRNYASLRCFQRQGFVSIYESSLIVILRKETT